MPIIHILIVDDSAAIRRLLSDVLSSVPTIDVVGTAATGSLALAKIPQLNPDLVILDVDMPGMNGLETLSEIRKTHPRLPVIMFSGFTTQGAVATIDALTRGANDYATKPTGISNSTAARQHIREQLVPKIQALLAPSVSLKPSPSHPAVRPVPPKLTPVLARAHQRVDIVAIGVSTGGPNALMELIPALPANFPVPIVIVQHMPRLFTGILAERLASQSAIQVREGKAGMLLEPAHAWLAPGDFHMSLGHNDDGVHLRLSQGPPDNACRPAANVLFRSVASLYGPNALAVVLTGMGQDGLRGCRAIHAAGGQILVQDEASSVVWGMPGCVAEAGLANQILPLHQIGDAILRRVEVGRPRFSPTRLAL